MKADSSIDVRDPRQSSLRAVMRIGILSWSIIGAVLVTSLAFAGLVKISSVVLPLIGGIGLAVIVQPLQRKLVSHRVPAGLAAAILVLLFIAVAVGMVVMTVSGVVDQAGAIGNTIKNALGDAGVDQQATDKITSALQNVEPIITKGFVSVAVGGLSALSSFAVGALLGTLVMYYVVKDGAVLGTAVMRLIEPTRRNDAERLGSASASLLRSYAVARSVVSAVVAFCIGGVGLLLGVPLVGTIVVVNFIGGYIPYVGAVLGGGLAVIVAFADGGIGPALGMLVAVFAANLVVENFIEPKILGDRLGIHPLAVLLVTAAGGVLGGLIGLMVAVPVFLIAKAALEMWFQASNGDEADEVIESPDATG